jgi:hypothetical protein
VNDLFLGDDNNYVKLPGSELNPATYGVEIGTDNRNLGPQNIEVFTVDELVPPGGVWRFFIDHEDYPNLGSSISVGDTVTTSWGTPITATITDVIEEPGNQWKIHVAQDITAGFDSGDTVSFGVSGDSYTWRFGTDGVITLPNSMTIDASVGFGIVRIGGDNTRISIDNGGAPPGFTITTSDEGTSVDPKNWRFGPDGELTFPDGSIQTTAYTGQTGSSGVIYIMANVDGNIVTSTDGVTWGDPVPSGMPGISRVAVHNGVIVYIDGGDGPPGSGAPGMYYSTVIGTVALCTGTDVFNSDPVVWTQVRYFDEPNKWVAVGFITGGPSTVPILAHSTNGISWTLVPADNTFVTGFNTGDDDWQLTDVAYVAETGEFVISSVIDADETYGGIFITDDVTVPLTGATHVAIDVNVSHTAPWSVVSLDGPPGYMALLGANDEVWFGNGTNPNDYDLDIGFFASSITDQIGYLPTNISEVAYDADGIIAVTGDGQVITSLIAGLGPYFAVSVPVPYTTTAFSITNANPAVLTYTPPNGNTLNNNEKIVITGSGEYNGTYYWQQSNGALYTNQALSTALDASGFATFASGGTLTMSHGQYFDAAGTSASYYYIGNDDEQIFRSSNGFTWTQLADVTGEYFNDFAYGTFGTASSGQGGASITDSGDVVITAGSTAHWVATQRRNGENTEPRGLRYDSQGNLYALTKTYDDTVGNDVAVITKYTAAGSVSWQKSFTNAYPVALAVDSSDCAYITVSTGDPVITVMKFNAAGTTVLWKKEYDIGNIVAYGAFIEEKSLTTLALAFTLQDGEIGPNIVVVMEINSTTGAVEIKRQISFELENRTVQVAGIDVDANENVFVTGFYYDVGDDVDKMFIEKLDQNLERVWSKSLETLNGYDMYGGDCASDALGNIYAVGTYNVETVNDENGTTSKSAGILTKLNSLGVVQWTRRLGPGPCGGFAAGLTVTSTGNVYLSALTYDKNTSSALDGYPDFIQEVFGANKMIVVRYNTQGAVIWQRYVDVTNLYENYDTESLRGQAVAVFDDKFAVSGYGRSWNTTPFNFGGSADNEDDYFVAQLPTDGTALTIGNLNFTESRVPARFITHTASDSPLDNIAWTTVVTPVDSARVADAEPKIANNIVKSETYAYTFGADGTLAIPNDGDLKLTQSQVGYLIAIGGSINTNDNIYSRAVTVDSQGNMYVVGQEEDNDESFVMKISPDGVRQWSVRVDENSDGYNNRANGVSIHPTTGNVVVVCEIYYSYQSSVVITLDQDTGRILDVPQEYNDAGSDVYLVDLAYTSTGTPVVVGSKYGEFVTDIPVTKQTGSATGVIKILRSAIPGAPYNWQIGGTGFSVFENIAYVERYTGVTGTTRQGTGATFNITDNGDGTYSAGETAAVSTNYCIGHKIKILGSAIGGVDVTNDCIITVSAVNAGAISDWGSAGLAAGSTPATYNSVSGTNYNVGSGLEFTFESSRNDTNYGDYYG